MTSRNKQRVDILEYENIDDKNAKSYKSKKACYLTSITWIRIYLETSLISLDRQSNTAHISVEDP